MQSSPVSEMSGNEEGEVRDMVSNLTKSKEAMSALGSAVAEQVLEAMKMQGRQAGQPSTPAFYGSHPAPAPGAMLPPHVAAPPPPVGAHAHNPGMGCMGFPFGIPYTDWSSAWPGHTRAPVSPFTRLGPPRPPVSDQEQSLGDSCSSSYQPSEGEQSGVHPPSEDEDLDSLSLHPDPDRDLEIRSGTVSDKVKTLVQESVKAPLSNQQRKRALESFPLPKVEELRPPRLDTTLKLLIPKSTTSHDTWLQKMQALSVDAYAPIIVLLNEQEEGCVPSPEELQSALQCSLKLMGNVYARLTQERRRKVLCAIHKDLGHMAEEEFKSSNLLFGDEVVDRVKKRHDALKTLRSVKQPFRRGGAQKPGQSGRRENQGHLYQGQYKGKGPLRKPRYFPKGHSPQNKKV